MRTGKVPENVLKRSVLKQIRHRRDEVILGAGVGEDCGALEIADDEMLVYSTDVVTLPEADAGPMAVIRTTNNLAAAGAVGLGILVSILLPEGTREIGLKRLMIQLEQSCSSMDMQILGGHTQVSSAVNRILVHVTGVGKVKKDRRIDTAGARPGMDLVITRWIGLEGTALMAKAKKQELKQRFPADFVEDAIRFRELLSVIPEAAVAAKTEAAAMHDGSWGGIFGALWELAEASGTGLVIDLKKLPIRQETVEICEYFDLNPYELLSGGTMVIATAEGEKLVAALQDKAIPAVVAGRITSGNDRLVLRDGEKRFLEPPKQDALYRILE